MRRKVTHRYIVVGKVDGEPKYWIDQSRCLETERTKADELDLEDAKRCKAAAEKAWQGNSSVKFVIEHVIPLKDRLYNFIGERVKKSGFAGCKGEAKQVFWDKENKRWNYPDTDRITIRKMSEVLALGQHWDIEFYKDGVAVGDILISLPEGEGDVP